MAKKKYWVIDGVPFVVTGDYVMGKPNYIKAADGREYPLKGPYHGFADMGEAQRALKGGARQQIPGQGRADPADGTPGKAAAAGGKKAPSGGGDPAGRTSGEPEPGTYMGSDEAGKIEPLKQLTVTAVYARADRFEELLALGVDDSKKYKASPEKLIAIGKALTGYESYEEIEFGRVSDYSRETYGVLFCPMVLTNSEYNEKHEQGWNANQVVTELHNEANLTLYRRLREEGVRVQAFVIDDYMNGSGSRKFEDYLDDLKKKERITGQGLKSVFETNADSTYREVVGAASDICAYIDLLWQRHLNGKYGMTLNYGNNIRDLGTPSLRESFDRIREADPRMSEVKHTKPLEDYWKSE